MSRKGESIFLRKDGRYEGRFIKGYDKHQKAEYGYVYASNYSDCKRKKNWALINLKNSPKKTKRKSKETLGYLVNDWLQSKKGLIKESSFGRYYCLIETHIIPDIGKIKKHMITSDLINDYLTTKLKKGRLDGTGGLSNNTVYDIALILKQTFKRNNLDISTITIPKDIGKGKNLYSNETELIKGNISNLNKAEGLGILLSLFLGLREGEICGLKWNDIDIPNRLLHINQIISRVRCFDEKKKTKLIITTPKTDSSIRTLPIPDKLMDVLSDMKSKSISDSYVLTNTSKFMDPRTYYNHYKIFIKSIGLSNHTYHDLRHTFASNCIELGMDPKTLMELLGHANITTTLSIYVHSSMNNKRNYINQL